MRFLGVRNPEAAQKSVEKFMNGELTKGKVLYKTCDTGDMESVRNFAKSVQARYQAIHVLINNGKRRWSFTIESLIESFRF